MANKERQLWKHVGESPLWGNDSPPEAKEMAPGELVFLCLKAIGNQALASTPTRVTIRVVIERRLYSVRVEFGRGVALEKSPLPPPWWHFGARALAQSHLSAQTAAGSPRHGWCNRILLSLFSRLHHAPCWMDPFTITFQKMQVLVSEFLFVVPFPVLFLLNLCSLLCKKENNLPHGIKVNWEMNFIWAGMNGTQTVPFF